MTGSSSGLVPNPMIVAHQASEGAVLVDVNTGDCYELNRVGAEIWERLCRGESVEQVVEALSTSYAAAQTSIASDVATLIEELARSGILVSNR